MNTLSDPLTLSIIFALIVALFIYAFTVPRNSDKFHPEETDNNAIKALNAIGAEVYSTLPRGTHFASRNSTKLNDLLTHSGNPWNLKPNEFMFVKFLIAFIGFVGGWSFWFLSQGTITLPWFLIVPAFTIFGYMIPTIKYNDQAKKRDLEFKRQLPEALDLINISLTGGGTLAQAIRESIPNMKEGVLKEEFKSIAKQIDSGKTVSSALEYFAGRAPNDSIKTFVQAMREATELNVPLVSVLESRAKASREDYFNLLQQRTAVLTSKIMLVIIPTLLPALLIILLAPSISFFTTMGG